MIQVMIVDDHELVRTGIARVLDDVEDIKVLAEANCGEAAITMVKMYQPDVVLMDVNMPGIGGMEATTKLLKIQPNLKIIIVTVHAEGPFPNRLLQAGAMGYLTKGCASEEMIEAIRSVYRGEPYIDRGVAQNLALSFTPRKNDDPFGKLSQRELQVVMMLIQGIKGQDISDQLCLSPKTVSTYRRRVYEKLGIHSDVELTHMAMQHGLMNQK
jgi:two-component system invasion response regulator UvrY